jgi:glycosyltransferase involved in cell wall biosynthesis
LEIDAQELIDADLRRPPQPRATPHDGQLVLNWLISNVGYERGGLTGAIRMAAALEQRGHKSRVYITHSSHSRLTVREQADLLRADFPQLRAEVLADARAQRPAHACIATAWQTAYVAFNHAAGANRFYFVQDLEPLFYPAGSAAELARNTYRMNFYGVTLGPWLAATLRSEFGMPCGHFDFAADLAQYADVNRGPRRGVIFYARPGTARRGFELGVLALRAFHARRPEQPIHVVGSSLSGWRLGFPYVEHGHLSHIELAELYNRCSAGLVLSFTNASFLVLELLAAGCTPVVNDAPHIRMSLGSEGIVYAQPSPVDLAAALASAVDARAAGTAPDAPRIASWESSAQQLERILLERVSVGW